MPMKSKNHTIEGYPEMNEDDSMMNANDFGGDDKLNPFESGAVGLSMEIDEKTIAQALEDTTISADPVSKPCSGISEMLSDVPTLSNIPTTNNLDMSSLGAASFDGDWKNFFSGESVDDLLEFASVVQLSNGLKRLSKALEANLTVEANGSDAGLTKTRVRKIGSLIQRIRTESNTEARVQLLDILLVILHHYEDDFEILCSEKLKLKSTIENLLEMHLYMENHEPLKDVEFHTLMTISEWVERAMFTIEQIHQF